MSYILTSDIGTTGNKATLFDLKLNPISESYKSYSLFYPEKGWAEQKAEDFWNSIKICFKKIMESSQINPNDIAGIAFTCQMNCTIPIDQSGEPLMNCISWLDTRASELIITRMGGFPKYKGMALSKILFFKKHTGGGPGKSGKDPISHYMWIKEKQPDIYNKVYKFLSVKDYVIFKCTNQAITSLDLANTAWLKDPITDEYSQEVLKLIEVDENKLPTIKKSTDIAGMLTEEAAAELNLVPKIPVFNSSGDLTSVALGSGGINEKNFIICLGTADWVATHLPKRKTDIPHYIGTINSAQGNYLYISKQETGAACFNWIIEQSFRDLSKNYEGDSKGLYKELDSIVEKTPAGSKNLIFIPWMFGERSPINNSEVRGGFINLSLDHNRNDLLRAVYEGIAYNLKWSLDPMEKKIGKCSEINIIGGAANSEIWCQIIADILNRDIKKVRQPELGGTRGAAIIAMVGLSILNNFSDAIPLIQIEKIFKPNSENRAVYEKIFSEFEKFYKQNKKMFRNLNL
ncbi:MAG: xylulokinase [Promethearchaeota archaeon]